MFSAGESPTLHSLPRPTESRRHLTLQERGLSSFSGRRSRTWHSSTSGKYLKVGFSIQTLPRLPSVQFRSVWPPPYLPALVSLLIYPGWQAAARPEMQQIWASSFPQGADQRPAQWLHTRAATSGTTSSVVEETEPKLNDWHHYWSFPPAPQGTISISRALLTQRCCTEWS